MKNDPLDWNGDHVILKVKILNYFNNFILIFSSYIPTLKKLINILETLAIMLKY
jgi:hypothetical protein